jgi:outer membrane protein TolC
MVICSRRWRRWATGLASVTVTTFGFGCRMTDPPVCPEAPLYRSLRPGESAPVAVLPPALGAEDRPRHPARTPAPVAVARTMRDDSPPAAVPGYTDPITTAGGREQRAQPQSRADVAAPERKPTVAAVSGPAEAPGAAVSVPEAPGAAATGESETLDLGVALRLAGVDNPTINLAREQIREALGVQLGARSLLLPSLNIGCNYHAHSGTLQASFGGIRTVNSQSFYFGFGARTLAAESVAFPGVRLFAHLGDAVYEPLAARQRVSARRSEAVAVQNETLLRVAVAYLELVAAETQVEILRNGEADIAEVVRVTGVYALKGQGRQSDADRTSTRAQLLRQDLRRAEEEVGVASAALAEVVNLDPAQRLRSPGGPVLPVRLIPEDSEIETLVAQGVESRPELAARSAEVQEARTRVRQEQVRPWVPLLSAGYSYGGFGGGSNLVSSRFGPFSGRSDFDVFAVWNIQNLGFGNRAQVRRADAVVGEALATYDRTLNRVRREVIEALADARAAARQIDVSKSAVAAAEEGFRLESERIRLGQGRPIEALDSFEQLLTARRELVRAVTDYNVAQFRLFVAMGSNPLRVAEGK